MTEEVEFYVQIVRTPDLRHPNTRHVYRVLNFTQNRPSDPSGHVVRVTLTIDPSIFESDVQAHVGLGVEGLKAVVKELHDI